MKYVCLFILFVCLSCKKTEKNIENTSTIEKKIEAPKEEYPNIYTEPSITKQLGVIKYNPTSGNLLSGQTNIIQVLAKMIKQNPNASKLIIEYTKYMSSDYSNDITVEYDRTSRKVIETRPSGASDIYESVNDQTILNLAKDPEVSSLYMLKQMGNANFVADNSKMTIDAIGPKPEQKNDDYSVPIVVDYLKQQNPNSNVEYFSWSKVTSLGKDWIVRSNYSITNAAGQTQTNDKWFYIQNSKVVRTKGVY